MRLKDLFKEKHRYIKLDGTAWHAGGLRAAFQSVAVRATAVSLATMTALNLTAGYQPSLLLLAFQLTLIGVAGLHARNSDRNITPPYAFWYKFARHAIDTEGRAIPPQNEPELLEEVRRLRDRHAAHVKKYALYMGSLGTFFGVTDMALVGTILPGTFLPVLGMLPIFMRDTSLIRRCNKLLHKDHIYRFAATPPPLPVSQGLRAPARAKPGFS